jgi:chloride channel protein, CIC family
VGGNDAEPQTGIATICAIAAVAGVFIGFVGGAFRWCLVRADDWARDVVEWSEDLAGFGWVIPLALAAVAAVIARWIVLRVPLAGGSGIQHVEAVWRGEVDFAPPQVAPAKFVGGVLALGSGLLLGREGPTVQMGAVIGVETGRRFRLHDHDLRMLQAAVAGAGLAVAFNAPFGGAIFVFEEIAREFQARLVLVALASGPVAVVCSRLLVGNAFDLPVTQPPTPGALVIVIFAVFGLLTGLLAAVYNRLIVGAIDRTQRVAVHRPLQFAGVVGAVIGVLFFLQPLLVGEGTELTRDVLAGQIAMWPLAGYLVARGLLGPLSYAVGTPGGLFSPLLALGAVWGALFQGIADAILPGAGASATAFAVVGMAAFFAGVVRAPLTGVALLLEMTGATPLTSVALAACFAATLTATKVRSQPIYDTLRLRMLQRLE